MLRVGWAWLRPAEILGLHQLGTHAGKGAALQARHVHLRAAELCSDGVLVQVVEEPQQDDFAFQVGKRGDQAGQSQQVLWFLPGPGGGHQVAETNGGVVAG